MIWNREGRCGVCWPDTLYVNEDSDLAARSAIAPSLTAFMNNRHATSSRVPFGRFNRHSGPLQIGTVGAGLNQAEPQVVLSRSSDNVIHPRNDLTEKSKTSAQSQSLNQPYRKFPSGAVAVLLFSSLFLYNDFRVSLCLRSPRRHQFFMIVSSRFSRARATSVHAARATALSPGPATDSAFSSFRSRRPN